MNEKSSRVSTLNEQEHTSKILLEQEFVILMMNAGNMFVTQIALFLLMGYFLSDRCPKLVFEKRSSD